ncbi:histone deacetylase 8 [Hydra vulgaris]|uniref:Histone deacetylase n=1 Tax=Hydra vulgaris TaxID=6087 RepID=A0ABM4C432_HYDVU
MTSATLEIAYIHSEKYVSICDKHPKVKGRASMVHDLIESYDLLSLVKIVAPVEASRNDLLTYHTEKYIQTLEFVEKRLVNSIESHEEDCFNEDEINYINEIGLGYDCSLFSNIYLYAKAVVGGTLSAANCLIDSQAVVSINLNGGWHHAHTDEASGFCYVNDIVIGILKLLTKFKKIFYIDLDVHHGDYVEEAFLYTNKVVTFSIHKFGDGFFPGTGMKNSIGKGKGKYYTINAPLKDGVDNKMFTYVFKNIFTEVFQCFSPEVIVVQCGADCLTGDPLGSFNLTSEALVDCVKFVLNEKVPTMILGGGGYNLSNTARCWTQVIAGILNATLNNDIPEHEKLECYGPDFALSFNPNHKKNENSLEYIEDLLSFLKGNIKFMRGLSKNEISI